MKKTLFIFLVSFNASAVQYDLSWQLPVERENGAVLNDAEIDHLNVYWGTVPGDYQNTIVIDRKNKTPFPTTYKIDFTDGYNYYLVMTTVDIDGRESLYSNEAKILTAGLPGGPVLLCKPNADFNGDGVVNAADLSIFKQHFFNEY